MSDNLATSLHDHLAGAVAGLELVEALPGQQEGEALGRFAAELSVEIALWDALSLVAPQDARLRGLDFAELSHRARTQHARVEEQRLNTPRTALRLAVE